MSLTRRNILKMAGGVTLASTLSGCLGGGNAGVEFHRNTARNISSTTRFDGARFSGRWVIRGEFTHPGEKPLFGSVGFEAAGGQITALDVKNAAGGRDRYAARQIAPGRVSVGMPPFDTQYWVLWVDADYRTAAIGTPSGSFGWIIARDATGGADRIKAAKDMLAFNGYDLSRLQTR